MISRGVRAIVALSMASDDSSQYVVRLRDGSSVTASREVSKQLRSMTL